MFKMRKCAKCSTYTFRERCPKCKGETASPHPPRFSPEDRYGRYRRKILYGQGPKDKG